MSIVMDTDLVNLGSPHPKSAWLYPVPTQLHIYL